ncbi:MAG: Calx-beta domain-containing protein [Gammaproteobacteria bacterium]
MNIVKHFAESTDHPKRCRLLFTLLLFLASSMGSPVALSASFSFTSSNYSSPEDSGSITANVQFDPTGSCPFGECYDELRITWETSSGTATGGTDYLGGTGTLSWTANTPQTQDITISLNPDTQVEADETFRLSIVKCEAITFFSGSSEVFDCSSEGVSVGPISGTTMTIVNDDAPSLISLDNTNISVDENAGNVTVTATRSGSLGGAVSVLYNTASGTATEGQDYTSTSGQLTWADGEGGSKSFVVPIIDDKIVESPETFSVNLSSPSPANSVELGQSTASVTIVSDDSSGTVDLESASFTINEKEASVTITAIRSGGADGAVSVDFNTVPGTATAGQDYTETSGTLSWNDGESGAKSFTVAINPDSLAEPDENFTVTLSNPTNNLTLGLAEATVTIVNQTLAGELAFATTAVTVAEGSQVTLTVVRSGGGDGPVSVDFATQNGTATADADFTSASGTLSWADQDTEPKSIIITTLKDSIAQEANETFSVLLSNPTGSATLSADTATVTLTDATEALTDIPDLTPNQKSIAGALDKACGAGAEGEFKQLCDELFTSGNAKQILESIVPEQIAAQGTSAVEFGFLQLKFLHGRIVSLRSNDKNRQFDILGLNVNMNGNSMPLGQLSQFASQTMYGGAASADNTDEPFRDSPLGFFLKGQITVGNRDSSGRQTGYDIETKGITLGADYRFTDDLVMGLAAGYGNTQNDFNNNKGDMTTESGDFSLYGSYYLPEDFYVDWIFSYTLNAYDMNRKISFPGVTTSALSNPNGHQYGFSFGLGKDFFVESTFISPYGRIEYLDTTVDAYSERAAGAANLAVQEQNFQSVMTTFGGQISQAISMPWGVISPGVRAEWVHQFKYNDREINARFINAPTGTGQFTILTDTPDRNYFNLGASIAASLPEGRSAFFRYEARVGQERVSSHTLELGVRVPF